MKVYLRRKRKWDFGSLIAFLILLTSAYGDKPHSRQKRILWVTSDGRLALPPGTTLVVGPSLSMPFVRYPPDGFHSNLTISLPFTIDFDKLGLTDNENPYGVLPPLLARSMGTGVADLLGNYIESMLAHKKKRIKRENMPKLPEEHANAFHGGERALLYTVIQDFLDNFGLDGKACLLRAICEIHAHPMTNFGLFGEFFKLFLTASKSPYSHLLKEYVDAENAGKGTPGSPGECWPYLKDCPKSLFLPKHNKYSGEVKHDEKDDGDDDVEEISNEVDKRSITYKSTTFGM